MMYNIAKVRYQLNFVSKYFHYFLNTTLHYDNSIFSECYRSTNKKFQNFLTTKKIYLKVMENNKNNCVFLILKNFWLFRWIKFLQFRWKNNLNLFESNFHLNCSKLYSYNYSRKYGSRYTLKKLGTTFLNGNITKQ